MTTHGTETRRPRRVYKKCPAFFYSALQPDLDHRDAAARKPDGFHAATKNLKTNEP